MLHSLNDLLNCSAKVQDTSFTLKNAFFSLEERQLDYLALDVGTWLQSDLALISTRLISDVSLSTGLVTLNTCAEDIKAAPNWQDGSSSLLEVLPPIIIGPLGNTISPMMIAAILENDNAHRTSGAAYIDGLLDFTSFVGLDVFGKDGELGRAKDILFDASSLSVTHIVVRSSQGMVENAHIIPIEKLRYKAAQETHLVLDLTTVELENAPRLSLADAPEDQRIADLRKYYELPIV